MPSYLSSLTMIKNPDKPKDDPLAKIRNRIIKNLGVQKEIVQCLINGERYVGYNERWVTNSETKVRELILKPKNIKPWFYQHNDKYIFEIRFFNKAIELQPSKEAISVNDISEIPPLINLLINALKAGELDRALKKVTHGK